MLLGIIGIQLLEINNRAGCESNSIRNISEYRQWFEGLLKWLITNCPPDCKKVHVNYRSISGISGTFCIRSSTRRLKEPGFS
jgi:hypothetical protein